MLEEIFAVSIILGFAALLVAANIRVFEYVLERIKDIKYKELELDLKRSELFIRLKELQLPDNEIPQVIMDVFKDRREEESRENRID